MAWMPGKIDDDDKELRGWFDKWFDKKQQSDYLFPSGNKDWLYLEKKKIMLVMMSHCGYVF